MFWFAATFTSQTCWPNCSIIGRKRASTYSHNKGTPEAGFNGAHPLQESSQHPYKNNGQDLGHSSFIFNLKTGPIDGIGNNIRILVKIGTNLDEVGSYFAYRRNDNNVRSLKFKPGGILFGSSNTRTTCDATAHNAKWTMIIFRSNSDELTATASGGNRAEIMS